MKIAIIGSGMAGLATARILKNAGHDVTIFEALSGRGMDSHSLHFEGGLIDAPLRVMNQHLWKNTLSLATSLGIETFPVRTYMGCTWLGDHLQVDDTWLTTARSKIGNFPIINNRHSWQHYGLRLSKGLWQLKRALKDFFASEQQDVSLAQFMNQYPIEPIFWHGCMMPVLYTICTCSAKTMGEWPAKPLLTFLQQLTQGEALLRMQGGTPALVNALIQDIAILAGAAVQQLRETAQGVDITTAQGTQSFDRVVVATPTNRLKDFMHSAEFADDLTLLQQFQFEQGDLVVHTDQSVMPRNRKQWSALSYMMTRDFSQQQFSVWLNAVEPSLVGKSPVFQTWRPVSAIDPSKIISTARLTRAVVDARTSALHHELNARHQQTNRKVFYCGSWSCDGLPILESAVTSAMQVAACLGAPSHFAGLKPVVKIAPELGY